MIIKAASIYSQIFVSKSNKENEKVATRLLVSVSLLVEWNIHLCALMLFSPSLIHLHSLSLRQNLTLHPSTPPPDHTPSLKCCFSPVGLFTRTTPVCFVTFVVFIWKGGNQTCDLDAAGHLLCWHVTSTSDQRTHAQWNVFKNKSSW